MLIISMPKEKSKEGRRKAKPAKANEKSQMPAKQGKSTLAKAREINREATRVIAESAKQKLKRAKDVHQAIAIELINLILILAIIIAAIFFVVPDEPVVRKILESIYPPERVDEHLMQLPQPPLSYVLFIIVVVAAVWIYSYTSWFRAGTKKSRKMLALEAAIVVLLFISIIIYFDPTINIIPPPFSYLVFGTLLVALICVFFYVSQWRR